jgi:hypothetical protein
MRPVWSTASAVPGHTLVQSDAGMIGNSRGALVRGENRSGFALQIATSVVPHMPLRGGEGAAVFAQVRMRPSHACSDLPKTAWSGQAQALAVTACMGSSGTLDRERICLGVLPVQRLNAWVNALTS